MQLGTQLNFVGGASVRAQVDPEMRVKGARVRSGRRYGVTGVVGVAGLMRVACLTHRAGMVIVVGMLGYGWQGGCRTDTRVPTLPASLP